MDVKEQIKSFMKQAELYRSQGLLNEAKEKYTKAGQLVKKTPALSKDKTLLNSILKKLKELNAEIDRIENTPSSVEVSEEVQEIIKTKFSYSQDQTEADLEGAVALAKFGQFSRALNEFNRLIDKEPIRLDAAKNIIRCHVALDSLDKAVSEYETWCAGDMFTPAQLNKLRVFLQSILDKQGVDRTLPEIEEAPAAAAPADVAPQAEETPIDEGEILDISSIGITMENGPMKGETVEFDVSFQSGSIINCIISSTDKNLLENLKSGMMLNEVQFYSPIAMFHGKAVVSNKAEIETGPKQGHYSLDIQIKSM